MTKAAGPRVLVIDAGTSGPKVLVFDPDGQVVAAWSRPWPGAAPPGSTGMAGLAAGSPAQELNAARAWRLVLRGMTAALRQAGVSPSRIAAVGVTGMRQGVAFLDRRGRVIYLGPNLDLRAVFEGAALEEEMGDAMRRITGHSPAFFFTAAKLRWFREHRPQDFEDIATVLTLPDWITWRLTGAMAREVTLAGEAGLLDVARRRVCHDLFGRAGVDRLGDAPLVAATEPVATLDPAAYRSTGLRPGIPVVTAGADTQCGLLGLGVATPGRVGAVTGWSLPLQAVVDRPLDADARAWVGCLQLPDRWVVECNAGDVGNAVAWAARLLFGRGPGAFRRLDEAARASRGSEGGPLAFLGHGPMDMADLGVRTGGFLFPTPISAVAPGLGDLAGATLASAAFALRANLEQLEAVAGIRAPEVAVGGGLTRLRAFADILPDVLGRRVLVAPEANVTALGALLCVLTALDGEGPEGLARRAKAARAALEPRDPRPSPSLEWAERYTVWQETMEKLRRVEL